MNRKEKPMDDLKTLRLKLEYWRTRRAMSINDLAKVANVSSATILKIENHRYMPRPKVVNRLAVALNISLDELLIDDDEHHRTDERLLATA
jgi:ribosome-binding protein aMBF1 (putative translation factor)